MNQIKREKVTSFLRENRIREELEFVNWRITSRLWTDFVRAAERTGIPRDEASEWLREVVAELAIQAGVMFSFVPDINPDELARATRR